MSPASSSRDDLILQRLDQIHSEIVQVREDLKSDLHDYELKALHDKDVENLTKRDDDQEEHLNRLEERVFGQGQRFLINLGAAIGALGGLLGILHLFHVI